MSLSRVDIVIPQVGAGTIDGTNYKTSYAMPKFSSQGRRDVASPSERCAILWCTAATHTSVKEVVIKDKKIVEFIHNGHRANRNAKAT